MLESTAAASVCTLVTAALPVKVPLRIASRSSCTAPTACVAEPRWACRSEGPSAASGRQSEPRIDPSWTASYLHVDVVPSSTCLVALVLALRLAAVIAVWSALIRLDLGDLSLGQPHARQDRRLISLDLRLCRSPAKRSLADRVQVRQAADRRVRRLRTRSERRCSSRSGASEVPSGPCRTENTPGDGGAVVAARAFQQRSRQEKSRVSSSPHQSPMPPPPNIPFCRPPRNADISAARDPRDPKSPPGASCRRKATCDPRVPPLYSSLRRRAAERRVVTRRRCDSLHRCMDLILLDEIRIDSGFPSFLY